MFIPLPQPPECTNHADATLMWGAQRLVDEGWRVCQTYLDGGALQDFPPPGFCERVRESIETLPPGTVVLTSGLPLRVEGVRQYVCHHAATTDMGAITIPYWLEDQAQPRPFEIRRWFASFQGAVVSNHGLRQAVVEGFRDCPRAHCRVNNNYFHALPEKERVRLGTSYWEILSDSQFSLCPRGDHASSVRFYESLASGCIPVLLADNARLPLERVLPWEDMIVRVPESRATQWQSAVAEWMSRRTAADLSSASRNNRKIFEDWLRHSQLSRQLLVERVERAIQRAERRQSSLSREALELPGMSSGRVRHFLNNLQPQRYLEVGVWRGSTFLASCFGNDVESATAIDDFSQFQDDDSGERQFRENMERLLPGQPYTLWNQSFFDVPREQLPQNVDVYFYDGDHSYESQRRAIVHAWPSLQKEAVIVVDDSLLPGVLEGTRQGLQDVQAEILHEWNLPARYNGDAEQWWDGLYVAAVRKAD